MDNEFDRQALALDQRERDTRAALTQAKGEHARAALKAQTGDAKATADAEQLLAEVDGYERELRGLDAARAALDEARAAVRAADKAAQLTNAREMVHGFSGARVAAATAIDKALAALARALDDHAAACEAGRVAVLQTAPLLGVGIEAQLPLGDLACDGRATLQGALFHAIAGHMGNAVDFVGFSDVHGSSVAASARRDVARLLAEVERWQLPGAPEPTYELVQVVALQAGHDGEAPRAEGDVFMIDATHPRHAGQTWFIPVSEAPPLKPPRDPKARPTGAGPAKGSAVQQGDAQ